MTRPKRRCRPLLGLVLLALAAGASPAGAQELRPAGSVHPSAFPTSEPARKIAPRLRGLAAGFRAQGIAQHNAAVLGAARRFSSAMLKVDDAGRVQVYVRVTDTSDDSLARLRQHGLDVEIVEPRSAVVQGWLPVENLEGLAGEPGVLKIRPPSYATPRTGSVTSQGDAIHNCPAARALGITGAAVRVGVISDGVAGLAASQASGNLAAVEVLAAGLGDEGTAMLEIIHDCAPDAELAFASGFPTSLAFIRALTALRDWGARVIVDDLGFYGEPFFEDGDVALADRRIGAEVLRVSAAGNDRRRHYQGLFVSGGLDATLPYPGLRHVFAPGDSLLRFHVPASPVGREATIVLQWGSPFGAAADDYDLYIRQPDGTLLTWSVDTQAGTDDPIESIGVTCTGPVGLSCPADIEIAQFAGAARTLELFCLGCQLDEYATAADSVFGHPGVPEVLAVAAAPASAPFTIEDFSSAGPATILFPAVEVRPKPDITGTDGVATSRPGFNPFYGTSAAAPHVAAVAALMVQANPSYYVPFFTAFFREAVRSTAAGLGAPGWDSLFGFGRADALAAVGTELNAARCEVTSETRVVRVGESFSITVETFPGGGDPWDVYLLAIVTNVAPIRIFSYDSQIGGFAPIDVVRPARPTEPVTQATYRLSFVAPAVAEIGFLCILADPGMTRISRLSFAPVSFVP
ncbi:MAG TPA: S8 family serine peptidase [Methylomirabilota bacterium]|jgi:subtilisin family serine protease|nr:S8 family serine peptidase [Methylomirabilota bacterium]